MYGLLATTNMIPANTADYSKNINYSYDKIETKITYGTTSISYNSTNDKLIISRTMRNSTTNRIEIKEIGLFARGDNDDAKLDITPTGNPLVAPYIANFSKTIPLKQIVGTFILEPKQQMEYTIEIAIGV